MRGNQISTAARRRCLMIFNSEEVNEIREWLGNTKVCRSDSQWSNNKGSRNSDKEAAQVKSWGCGSRINTGWVHGCRSQRAAFGKGGACLTRHKGAISYIFSWGSQRPKQRAETPRNHKYFSIRSPEKRLSRNAGNVGKELGRSRTHKPTVSR